MRLTVVGAGYVGLVAAACFAGAGHEVCCVERDPERLACLLDGHAPFHEPGLDELLGDGLASGRLRFSATIEPAPVIVLAVGTPCLPDGSADDSQLLAAAAEVARAVCDPTVVIVKSTAPVGTSRRVQAHMGPDVRVVANPEFLREGAAVADFLRPERVVAGTTDPEAAALLRELYAPFVAPERVHVTDPASAELAKYASNTMLAVRVALANELAALCEAHGADIHAVTAVMGADPRIGPAFLQPSLGYGGSCLPKDVRALAAMGRAAGAPQRVAEAADAANAAQRERWLERIREHLGELRGRTIAVWGLAFKAGTGDVRESAALALAVALKREGAHIRAHDPLATALDEQVRDPLEALRGAEALVVGTAWEGYAALDPAEHLAQGAVVLDGRNLYDPARFRGTGIRYVSLGRPDVA